MRRSLPRRVATFVPVAALALTTVTQATPASGAAAPEVGVGDVTIVEGDVGTANTMKFAVTLSEPAASDVVVQWDLVAGTATADVDHVGLRKPKTTKIRAGKTSAFASVKVLPDTTVEADETVSVELQSVSGPAVLGASATGTGTILDDDGASGPEVNVGDASVVETHAGQAKLALPITLSEPLAGSDVVVTWTLGAGTATPDVDHKSLTKPRTTRIRAGKTSAQATLTTYGDTAPEEDETVTVQITGVAIAGAPAVVGLGRTLGTGTLVDDDPEPLAPPEAPTGVVASPAGGTQIQLAWTPAATGGPAEQFAYEYSGDAGTTWVPLAAVAAPPVAVDLGAGTFTFRVRAENAAGPSAWSDPSGSVTVGVEAPGVPTDVVASTDELGEVVVDWDAPVTGGAPDSYELELSADAGETWIGAAEVTAPETIGTLGSLAAGTYVFRVRSENAAGTSDWSATSNELVVESSCPPDCVSE